MQLMMQDDYVAAERLFRRVVEGKEKSLGPEHSSTLASISFLAIPLEAQLDYPAAESLYRRAFEGREKVLGPDHLDTLMSANNLMLLLSQRGDYAAAEPLCRRVVAGREKALGPDHPDTLTSVHNLALLLYSQGDYASAYALFRRAVAGFEQSLGSDHDDTLSCINNLADCVDALSPLPAVFRSPDPPGTVVNSVGMKFVPIPAGEFLMGPPADCPGDPEKEFECRGVRISSPFLLGMHQVTQSQYEEVTDENPSFFKGLDLPVEHLTWNEARRFCELLSDLPEERAAGRRYRLPTEAEWEYACRAGTNTTFNTGDTLELDHARFATIERLSPKPTAPVGTYPPNAWGLFDMHGNVWEWTNDWFSADYPRERDVDDPQGPAIGTHHTLHGGSASVEAHECRSDIRGEASEVDGPETDSGNPVPFYGDFGIRVVCQQSG